MSSIFDILKLFKTFDDDFTVNSDKKSRLRPALTLLALALDSTKGVVTQTRWVGCRMEPRDAIAFWTHVDVHHCGPDIVLFVAIRPYNFIAFRDAVHIRGRSELACDLLGCPADGQDLKLRISEDLLDLDDFAVFGGVCTPGKLAIWLTRPHQTLGAVSVLACAIWLAVHLDHVGDGCAGRNRANGVAPSQQGSTG